MPAKKEMTEAEKTAREAEKAKRFKDLAEKRTGKALGAIAAIRGCANKGNYSYTEEQAAKIVEALRAEVDVVEKAFAGKAQAQGGFSL